MFLIETMFEAFEECKLFISMLATKYFKSIVGMEVF